MSQRLVFLQYSSSRDCDIQGCTNAAKYMIPTDTRRFDLDLCTHHAKVLGQELIEETKDE